MLGGQIAIARASAEAWEADESAEVLYASIPQLQRILTVNKATFANILPAATGHDPAWHVLLDDGSDLSRLERVFMFDGDVVTPRFSSIRHRPWPRPGNCVGRYSLRLPDQRITDAIGCFFDDVGHPEYGPDADGSIKPFHALFGIGIEVGRQTVLRPDNSPIFRD